MNRHSLTKLANLLRAAGDVLPADLRRRCIRAVMEALGETSTDELPPAPNPRWNAAIEEAMRKGNGRFIMTDLTKELNVVPTVLGSYISKHYPEYKKSRFRVDGKLKWGRVL